MVAGMVWLGFGLAAGFLCGFMWAERRIAALEKRVNSRAIRALRAWNERRIEAGRLAQMRQERDGREKARARWPGSSQIQVIAIK